jgi:hypothetical protein
MSSASFVGTSVREVLPDSKISGGVIKKASVLKSKRQVMLPPQSAQSVTIGASGTPPTINFLIQAGTNMVDLQSMVLTFNIRSNRAFEATKVCGWLPGLVQRLNILVATNQVY